MDTRTPVERRKARETMIRIRERQAKGICIHCGAVPAMEGRALCCKCWNYSQALKAWHAERKKLRQEHAQEQKGE